LLRRPVKRCARTRPALTANRTYLRSQPDRRGDSGSSYREIPGLGIFFPCRDLGTRLEVRSELRSTPQSKLVGGVACPRSHERCRRERHPRQFSTQARSYSPVWDLASRDSTVRRWRTLSETWRWVRGGILRVRVCRGVIDSSGSPPVLRWRVGRAKGLSRPPETASVCSGRLSHSGKPRLRGREFFLVRGETNTSLRLRFRTTVAIRPPIASFRVCYRLPNES
jgi:hypothetical protein